MKNDAVCIETLAGNQEGKGNRKRLLSIDSNLYLSYKRD
ncbi:hypothetical protein M089_2315 [Bacteroides ovatus str. 3725 D9 iii]|uniref:Uncharacterized protein n=1 Tax=Bacteroides ovatus (strain ATCC 8483 / DSM 1896 / JCM 5824 / BCRC 10623 / CCUG 4943 / NCTC 11153) TaxID=411476 RepID=A0AAN3ADP1_BACO1|nr:hypothetical protein BACOVA_00113 [Bacteroides ovatus ATCC 8483]EEO53212.1 hypothetical protein BSCG_00137 [Bacteroides sp. 2_2_4]KDS10816.1 hypothetical protein M088_4282 [Bacteroides ovatus str. 3725 D1 iv]KDS15449.1 hypothetical protein M082_5088 [Bacteroides fragilis str. 3725 D9 ii]KDS41782.1 hypothetical protein M089_2315 [Bacteroides ovatus str. 3725 D9 iii]CAG9870444.1 hypothetical protein BOVAC1_4799 [Bacteroides ovatus]